MGIHTHSCITQNEKQRTKKNRYSPLFHSSKNFFYSPLKALFLSAMFSFEKWKIILRSTKGKIKDKEIIFKPKFRVHHLTISRILNLNEWYFQKYHVKMPKKFLRKFIIDRKNILDWKIFTVTVNCQEKLKIFSPQLFQKYFTHRPITY